MMRRYLDVYKRQVCRGGYPGHGETYMSGDDVLWWSHGGRLKGESWKRFKFLHKIMCETPGIGLAPVSYTHLDVYKRQVSLSTFLEMAEAEEEA